MADRGSTLVRDGGVPVTVDGSGDRVRVGVDLVGRELLHFRVVARLGAGGMGVVYKAIDQKLRRAVALKVLAARYVADERNKELIFREARSAASLAHPNIAAIHELHDTPDGAFFVMELVDGETLRARLARDGRFALRDALGFAAQIARALARAHEAGVVHRDLKADNVMVTRGGELKLLDFGLAKVVDQTAPSFGGAAGEGSLAVDLADHASIGDAAPHSHSPGLAPTVDAAARATEAGRVMGTPASMAPEQARGERVDARADVFAFGVLLYEMLAGAAPFPPRDGVPSGEASSGDWAIVAPVAAAAPRTPALVQHIVTRCLAFDRADRYPDGAALVHAIDACAPRARRSRLAIALIALVLAGAAGVTALALTRNTGSDAPDLSSACDATSRLDTTWTAAERATVAVTKYGADDIAAYDAFAAAWRAQHHDACRAPAAVGGKQLACLDAAVEQLAAQLHRTPLGHTRPGLPPLSRCTGDDPGRAPVVRRLGATAELHTGMALSPDGARYAIVGGSRLVVASLAAGSDEAAMLLPPTAMVEHWTGAQIAVVDHDRLLHADPARATLTPVAALPDYLALSPDETRALIVDATGHDVHMLSLADGTRSPLPISEPGDLVWARWSRGDQLALCFSTPTSLIVVILDLATGRSSRFPLRLDTSYDGILSMEWADDHRLWFVGRSEVERNGGGIWQASARSGQVGDITLILPATPDTYYVLGSVAAGRLIANEVRVYQRLARIRGGKSEDVALAPVITALASIDSAGEHVFVERDGDSGIVTLATGTYTRLVDRAVLGELDGTRVLVREGNEVVSLDARSGRRLATITHPGTLGVYDAAIHCAAAAPGHCALEFVDHGTQWLARLDGDTLGEPFALDDQHHGGFAISPDGRRVVMASKVPNSIDLVELATGHRESWPVPTPPTCDDFQYFAWSRRTAAVYATVLCTGGPDSRLLRIDQGKPPVEIFAHHPGWISGLAIGPDEVPVLGLRSYAGTVVLVDGL